MSESQSVYKCLKQLVLKVNDISPAKLDKLSSNAFNIIETHPDANGIKTYDMFSFINKQLGGNLENEQPKEFYRVNESCIISLPMGLYKLNLNGHCFTMRFIPDESHVEPLLVDIDGFESDDIKVKVKEAIQSLSKYPKHYFKKTVGIFEEHDLGQVVCNIQNESIKVRQVKVMSDFLDYAQTVGLLSTNDKNYLMTQLKMDQNWYLDTEASIEINHLFTSLVKKVGTTEYERELFFNDNDDSITTIENEKSIALRIKDQTENTVIIKDKNTGVIKMWNSATINDEYIFDAIDDSTVEGIVDIEKVMTYLCNGHVTNTFPVTMANESFEKDMVELLTDDECSNSHLIYTSVQGVSREWVYRFENRFKYLKSLVLVMA